MVKHTRARNIGPWEEIYWRYHWKNSDPVLLTRKLGVENWILLQDKLKKIPRMENTVSDPTAVLVGLQNMDKEHPAVKLANIWSEAYDGGSYTKGMSKKERRQFMMTNLNKQAREGYKFWYRERPKHTRFGLYSMGAKHTFLGLSNAPRS
ncbi:unnamed protein product [Dicrocoelium dendriticum]|nr:unnamed protein product [Dicrocoelium dendriticum]